MIDTYSRRARGVAARFGGARRGATAGGGGRRLWRDADVARGWQGAVERGCRVPRCHPRWKACSGNADTANDNQNVH